MTKPIRGILFDLFHTLTAREGDWADLPMTSQVLGLDYPRWNDLLFHHSRWRLAGEETDPFVILKTLATQLDPTLSDERIREASEKRMERFRRGLITGIPARNVETLQELRRRGLRLALVSNADHGEVAGWSACPLAGLFDAEIFSCHVGMVKPEPEIYFEALKRIDLTADECLFVGDGGSNELVGARTVGLETVMVTGVIEELWPDVIPDRRPYADHEIRTIPELLALFPPA
ncbi:MAG: HAD family hydrolase [Candidatus Eisenbacteria bacterium]|uniref:HAD family hydrolase n=1 Tax=Eiseniibacteriota bacterium TaxID=2212470 RepID=A0A956RP68_UNCEI|nr:HAD family hydrolase [Candidatus Eisenbacteria bacterium]